MTEGKKNLVVVQTCSVLNQQQEERRLRPVIFLNPEQRAGGDDTQTCSVLNPEQEEIGLRPAVLQRCSSAIEGVFLREEGTG